MFDQKSLYRARLLVDAMAKLKLRVGIAESCTGGLLSALITAIPGSSAVLQFGHVTYSNESKIEFLGVLPETLANFGAVSGEIAGEMCAGLIQKHGNLDFAISITGIAGPSGGTKDKPVGLVYIGIGRKDMPPMVTRNVYSGERQSVRMQAAIDAIELLLQILNIE